MSGDFVHAFRLAQMDAVASARRWCSRHGVDLAGNIVPHSFAALRLLARDAWPGNHPVSFLLQLSANKPTGICENCFVTFTQHSSTSGREFQVLPPLNPDGGPIYLHTTHYRIEFSESEDASMDGHWETIFRISTEDKQRLVEIIRADIGKLSKRYRKELPPKSSGDSDEPVGSEWDTWSTGTGHELFRRQADQVYKHEVLKSLSSDACDELPALQELAFFKQLSRDYTWNGVTNVTEWIESAKKFPVSSRVPILCPNEDEDTPPDVLQNIDIPLDSKPIESVPPPDEDDTFEEDWGDHFFPRLPHFPRVIKLPKVPAAGVKVLVVDVIGTILDRESAVSKGLDVLFARMRARDGAGRFPSDQIRLREIYIEKEAIINHDSPSLPQDELVLRTLSDIAKSFGGVGLPKEAFREAAEVINNPIPFPESLEIIRSLSQAGYSIAFLSPFGEEKLASLLSDDFVQSGSLPGGIQALGSLYVPFSDGTMTALLDLAATVRPGILMQQIMVVTSSVARTVEVCNPRGIPTTLVRYPSTLESRVLLDTSAPTFEISKLSELHGHLLEVADADADNAMKGLESPSSRQIWGSGDDYYRIKDLYQSTGTLGSGSFGIVFSAVHVHTGSSVAIKWEAQDDRNPPVIPYERAVYRLLGRQPWLPRIHWSSVVGGTNFMVMDRVGTNIGTLLKGCRGKLSLKTVLMLGIRMTEYIQYIHSKGIVSRDVAWSNFTMGVEENSHMLYMIDFGLAKMYRNPLTGVHIPYREELLNNGAPRFVSQNTHEGIEPSRRDDLESLLYILLNLYHGRLPWQGIYAPDVQAKTKRMGEMKSTRSKTMSEFLEGSEPEFAKFFNHVKALGFADEPDYIFLKGLFLSRMAAEKWENDGIYDWAADGKSLAREDYRFGDTVNPPIKTAYMAAYY